MLDPYGASKINNEEYKSLYDNLMWYNTKINVVNIEINKNIGIDKQIYIDKINELDEKLIIVNQKLRVIRDKQFGKKDS